MPRRPGLPVACALVGASARGLVMCVWFRGARTRARTAGLWECRRTAARRPVVNRGGARRGERVVMILPQVHLRKPCYDFTFL